MTRRWILSLALGSCLALTSTVEAQGPGGGRGGFPGGGMASSPIMLLGSKEVQEELKLDDKQKEQQGIFIFRQNSAKQITILIELK